MLSGQALNNPFFYSILIFIRVRFHEKFCKHLSMSSKNNSQTLKKYFMKTNLVHLKVKKYQKQIAVSFMIPNNQQKKEGLRTHKLLLRFSDF